MSDRTLSADSLCNCGAGTMHPKYHLSRCPVGATERRTQELTSSKTLLQLLRGARPYVESQAGALRIWDGFGEGVDETGAPNFAPHVENATDSLLARIDAALAAVEMPAQPSETISDCLREIAKNVNKFNSWRGGQLEAIADDLEGSAVETSETPPAGHKIDTALIATFDEPASNQRADFERWLRDVHMLDATWDEPRNCYKEFPAHLAFQAWQAARAASDVPACICGMPDPLPEGAAHFSGCPKSPLYETPAVPSKSQQKRLDVQRGKSPRKPAL